MNGDDRDTIRTTIEKIGRRVSQTGEAKKIVVIDSVDEEGTAYKTTEVEKGLNDCGHTGETGAVCQICERFTICEAEAKSGKFACSSCGIICCPNPSCSITSLFHPGVRFCHRCGFRGLLMEALKERK